MGADEVDMTDEDLASVGELASVLADVPSFSPNTAQALLRTKVALEELAYEDDPELSAEIRTTLEAYEQSLERTCQMARIHQAAVLGKLKALVDQQKTLGALIEPEGVDEHD